MKAGGGKKKGSAFERKICKRLSLWVTNGEREDCFWRSAMSGGRATVQHRKGVGNRQPGDICSVSVEGHAFTDEWFPECKNVRDLAVDSFLLSNTGPLAAFWVTAQAEAEKYGKIPMIIAKQSRGPIIVIAPPGKVERWTSAQLSSWARNCDISLFEDMVLLDKEASRLKSHQRNQRKAKRLSRRLAKQRPRIQRRGRFP